jgi:hypothetical protein
MRSECVVSLVSIVYRVELKINKTKYAYFHPLYHDEHQSNSPEDPSMWLIGLILALLFIVVLGILLSISYYASYGQKKVSPESEVYKLPVFSEILILSFNSPIFDCVNRAF